MRVRTLPTVTGERAREVLTYAVAAFANLVGKHYTGIELYNAYLKLCSDQGPILGSVLSRPDMERIFLTPRYWMLHGIDPAAQAPNLAWLLHAELKEKLDALKGAIGSLESDRETFGAADLIVLPDTNVFLHHPESFESIPWAETGDGTATHIVVVVPILVVDELDRAKLRSDPSGKAGVKVGSRARTAVRTLEDWFRVGASHLLQTGPPVVEALIMVDDPDRPRIADSDWEIIDVARSIADVSGKRAVIVSFDTGMRLRARMAGVEATSPPGTSGGT